MSSIYVDLHLRSDPITKGKLKFQLLGTQLLFTSSLVMLGMFVLPSSGQAQISCLYIVNVIETKSKTL